MSLRTAVVGGGTVSARHLNGLEACPHTTLVAVCDVDDDRVRAAASEYDVTGYTDAATLFADANLDWVHVCTPPGTHLDLARQAIEAGVPAMIQKPITETVAEYEELAAVAGDHDVPVTPVHNHNFDPAMRRLTARVDAGDVGPVRAVDVHYTGQTFPDDVRRGEWAFDLPGGEFEEGLPHPLYLLLRVGGYPEAVADVTATTHLVREYERPFAYDGATLNYASADDVLCTATLLPGEVPDKAVHVYGDDGVLIADMVSQTLLALDRDYEASPVARARHNVDRAAARLRGNVGNVRSVIERWRGDDWASAIELDSLWYQIDAEARALGGEGDLPVPLEEGGWTIRLMAAIREQATEAAASRQDASVSQ
jgi:predicted dehydrogenase